jgi:hypothetical protein
MFAPVALIAVSAEGGGPAVAKNLEGLLLLARST